MSQKYKLDFWFEWQADTAFWPANDAAYDKFGVSLIYPENLPLTPETIAQVIAVSQWHDSSLNWDSPPDPGPWRQEECDRFNAAVKQLFETVVGELGDDFEVINIQKEVVEDPNLDDYLKDPKKNARRWG